jgi:hypothetical protein
MPSNLKYANSAVNVKCDAMTALLDNGYLRIYDGSQPATANTAISGQVLLAELRYDNPAFGAAVAGVAVSNSLISDNNANNTGTATWFRALQSDGTTPVMDGSVGLSDADLVLDNVDIVAGAQVGVASHTHTEVKG